MKRLSFAVIAILFLIGCGNTELSNEPPSPRDLGISNEIYSYEEVNEFKSVFLKMLRLPSRCESVNASGDRVRIARLKEFDQKNRILTYEVDYPVWGLKSLAKLRLATYRAILEELFPTKWLIKYEYNSEYPQKLGVPYSYSIYSYSSERNAYDNLVNKYTLQQKRSGILRFRDSKGRIIDRDVLYFIVIPDER
jgi:hypothetical protein